MTIVWPDNAIDNEWLQVGVRDTQNTGLSQPDFFFFGNRVGLSGIGPWRSIVSVGLDMMGAKHHPATMDNPVGVTALFDYNRDRLVNSTDELIARGGFGSPTMFVDRDDMYFGNDRLVLVEAALAAAAQRAGAPAAEAAARTSQAQEGPA